MLSKSVLVLLFRVDVLVRGCDKSFLAKSWRRSSKEVFIFWELGAGAVLLLPNDGVRLPCCALRDAKREVRPVGAVGAFLSRSRASSRRAEKSSAADDVGCVDCSVSSRLAAAFC